MKGKIGDKGEVNDFVQAVEIEQKMSLMMYREEKIPFFKITFSAPPHVPSARSMTSFFLCFSFRNLIFNSRRAMNFY